MKPRVLVVDDDAAVRGSIQSVLETTGYQTLTAPDGRAAELCYQQPIDLAILDLNLPRESGWDVFEGLTTRFPHVPVIIITGLSNQYRVAQAAGVSALIEKPVEVTLLLAVMEELLNEPREVRLRRMCGHQTDTRYFGRSLPVPPPDSGGAVRNGPLHYRSLE